MHEEILTREQKELLPVLKQFFSDFGLVGGTAAALHMGHRRSIDFDMFSLKPFENNKISDLIVKTFPIDQEIVNRDGEYTITVNKVKMTFYYYRFPINFPDTFSSSLRIIDLITLATMKGHALGGRAKWKDYVDLYFILRHHHSITEISKKSEEIFRGEFEEKLFRLRLALFFDINYSETVEFMPGFETPEHVIKEYLREASLV